MFAGDLRLGSSRMGSFLPKPDVVRSLTEFLAKAHGLYEREKAVYTRDKTSFRLATVYRTLLHYIRIGTDSLSSTKTSSIKMSTQTILASLLWLKAGQFI